jgi:hypothetical protein
MYYLATIGFSTDQVDREGNARVKKFKYGFQADSVEEVSTLVAEYCKGDTRDHELLGVVKMGVECIIDPKNNPEIYK